MQVVPGMSYLSRDDIPSVIPRVELISKMNMLNIVYSNLYKNITQEEINNFYKNSSYYVFRRKMHNVNQFDVKNINKESLIQPAFPKFLLPPNEILVEIAKLPKISSNKLFPLDNWNKIIGEFVCDISDLRELISDQRKKRNITNQDLLIKYLNKKGNENKDKDNYIYSIYAIDKESNNKYICIHMQDFTQKNINGGYTSKSSTYSSFLRPYTVKFEDGKIISEYKNIADKFT